MKSMGNALLNKDIIVKSICCWLSAQCTHTIFMLCCTCKIRFNINIIFCVCFLLVVYWSFQLTTLMRNVETKIKSNNHSRQTWTSPMNFCFRSHEWTSTNILIDYYENTRWMRCSAEEEKKKKKSTSATNTNLRIYK